MNERLNVWYLRLKSLKDENAQDLTEYALCLAMIAFAAVIGMETLANGPNNSFNAIANMLETYLPPAP